MKHIIPIELLDERYLVSTSYEKSRKTMRCVALFFAVQIGAEVVGGQPQQSQNHPSSPTVSSFTTVITSNPMQTIHAGIEDFLTATTSSSLSSWSSSASSLTKSESTRLFLPVTTSPPDPLGISQVSGFYGPGAWAAWFLTIVASWVRIFRKSEEKVDPNTALFLLGANWAAVDIFRSIHALLRLQSNQPEYELSFTKCMGNYGAAFTVVICGTLHALLQIPFTIDLFVGMKCMSRRLRILVVGLVLPLIALTATAFGPVLTGLGGTAIDFFPALYWKGTDNVLHAMLIVYSAGTSILLVAPSFWLVYALQQAVLPAGLVTMIKKVMSSPFNSPVIAIILKIYLLCSLLSFVVWSIVAQISSNDAWFWAAVPLLLPMVAFAWTIAAPAMWMMFVPGSAVLYAFKGYLHMGSSVSESCFFMPCAPQSISDEDQMYALLAGLFCLFGFEVLPPLFKEMRKRYKDRRSFVREVEARMRELEMRRRTAATESS